MVWYGGQFYALFFLTQTLKVDGATANILIAIALLIGTPCFILFGWLSDKIGRKPIMLLGFALAAMTYFLLFQGLTHFANPALEKALASAPVTVVADPSECSFQFNPVGISQFRTSCDIVKSALVARSVNYSNEAAPAGRSRSSRSATRRSRPSTASACRRPISRRSPPPSTKSSATPSPRTAIPPRPTRTRSTIR